MFLGSSGVGGEGAAALGPREVPLPQSLVLPCGERRKHSFPCSILSACVSFLIVVRPVIRMRDLSTTRHETLVRFWFVFCSVCLVIVLEARCFSAASPPSGSLPSYCAYHTWNKSDVVWGVVLHTTSGPRREVLEVAQASQAGCIGDEGHVRC